MSGVIPFAYGDDWSLHAELLFGLPRVVVRACGARQDERELGVGLGAHQRVRGGLVVVLADESVGLVEPVRRQLQVQRGVRVTLRTDLARRPDRSARRHDPLGRCRDARTAGHEQQTDEPLHSLG
jgi:hypothetical protein